MWVFSLCAGNVERLRPGLLCGTRRATVQPAAQERFSAGFRDRSHQPRPLCAYLHAYSFRHSPIFGYK